MSVATTMSVAQKLYEGGYITYMRTDSVEISEDGLNEIKKIILDKYGKEYYQKREYKNKSSNSQEAHEAIRPTHPELISLKNEINDPNQIKLYDLIWKRTIASQMASAKIDITTIQISISKFMEIESDIFYYFQTKIEKITFHGFMKVYVESKDDNEKDDNDIIIGYEGIIPKINSKLKMQKIDAKQEYKNPPNAIPSRSVSILAVKL